MKRGNLLLLIFCALAAYGQVTINPGDNIQSKINANPAGTTFTINAGTYRIATALIPLAGDRFIGATSCAPPAISCPAIISGSIVIGPSATFNGTNYQVTGQTQAGATYPLGDCLPSTLGCIYPEDLWFDGVPYQHLYSATLPTIGAGQWWFDYTNNIIYFHDNPVGHVVETSVAPGAFKENTSGGSNVTLQYLTIEEFAEPSTPSGGVWPWSGGGTDSYRSAHGLNWVINDCELWGHHGPPVNPNYGMQILNSYFHDNAICGICGGVATTTGLQSHLVIQGNLITQNNVTFGNYFSPGTGAGGIKFGGTFGAVIKNNTITNNEGAGLHFDVDSDGATVDGNTITGNIDGDGVVEEISGTNGGAFVVRNNVLKYNAAAGVANNVPGFQVRSLASKNMQAYCNVIETATGTGEQGWTVAASNRTYSTGGHANSTGNSVHHNTMIWDVGTAAVGYTNTDTANQPNFFINNAPPDYNTYHAASISSTNFQYDNNNSGRNSRITFATYESNGADTHGTVDTTYTSGFPAVSITSPPDQSTFANLFTISAPASDASGISKVEFYVDWNLKATLTSAPYIFNWANLATASHTVAAMGYSNAGIRTCYGITLNMVGSADPGGLVL